MNGLISVDTVDRELLQCLQDEFPLENRPWNVVAGRLDIAEGEALARAQRLSAEGIIRTLHIFVNTQKLGSNRSTLIAIKVPENDIDRMVSIINEYPSVTHNYRRNHEYNLWFTISEQDGKSPQKILEEIKSRTGVAESATLDLRTNRVFKVDVRFSLTNNGSHTKNSQQAIPKHLAIDQLDCALLRIGQEGIPLVKEPFQTMAAKLRIEQEQVIQRLLRLHQSGIIKRVGISINQRKLGMIANALVAWKVPGDSTEVIGAGLSSYPEITHCYERSIVPLRWEYNIYTVLHGYDRQSVTELVKRISDDTGIEDYVILFSTDQYKRTSMIHQLSRESISVTDEAMHDQV